MNVGNELELNWGPPNMALFYSAVQNGFNAVRIPCAWDMSGATTNISGGVTNYVINPAYMAQVKQTVDAAIAAGMYVMINDHWDDGWLQSNIGTTVDPVINAKVKCLLDSDCHHLCRLRQPFALCRLERTRRD
jgi:endoglucanase